jgi:hypothetical protein
MPMLPTDVARYASEASTAHEKRTLERDTTAGPSLRACHSPGNPPGNSEANDRERSSTGWRGDGTEKHHGGGRPKTG